MLKSNFKRMTFKDNTFDTVVDTFGLEYYVNPRKAIQEMRRVCKPGGLILVLASGLPENDSLKYYLRWKQPMDLVKFGRFTLRNWDAIFGGFDFEVIEKKRFENGSLYFYILRNFKKDKEKQTVH